MNIPKMVIVAGVEYAVNQKDVVIVDTDYCMGSCSEQDSEILLQESVATRKKEQVFVHELLHACLFEAGYQEHDEELVKKVGNILYQVLKDNYLYFGNKEGGEV